MSTPSVIKVKIDGQQTRVSTINYGSKSLKELSDVDLAGATSGDTLVYNANTHIFSTRKIGSATPVSGSLLPATSRSSDLGSETQRFRSLYLTGNTIDMDGTVIKSENITGAVSIIPAPTEDNPNPIGIVVSPVGGFAPIQTVGGEVTDIAIQEAVANSVTYLAFQGADAGFF